jgi:hypothetical protein
MPSRGGATLESSEPMCLVSSFEPGLMIWLSSWCSALFVLCDSHFAAQHEYIKMDNVVAIIDVALMRLHHKNCKQLRGGTTFEN